MLELALLYCSNNNRFVVCLFFLGCVKVDWTPELHRRFVQAVEQLGVDKAVPSRILEIMGIDCLTRHNIASHLQVDIFFNFDPLPSLFDFQSFYKFHAPKLNIKSQPKKHKKKNRLFFFISLINKLNSLKKNDYN